MPIRYKVGVFNDNKLSAEVSSTLDFLAEFLAKNVFELILCLVQVW